MTVGELIELYVEQYTGKDQSAPTKIGYWKESLGEWKLSAVTRQVVAEELERLKREPARQPLRGKESTETTRQRSQATVNRFLSTLSQIFNLAVDKGLLETNPCKGIKRGGEKSRFGRALSEDERTELLEKCKESEWDRLYLLVSLALSTGGRLSELMGLTWGDLDLKKAIAKVIETKNGTPRYLPIIPPVLEQIKALLSKEQSGNEDMIKLREMYNSLEQANKELTFKYDELEAQYQVDVPGQGTSQ